MEPLWILLNIYFVVEGINYIEYLIQKQKLEKYTTKKSKKNMLKKAKLYVNKINEDLHNHVKEPNNYLENLFCGQIKSFSKKEISKSLIQCFYYPFHKKIRHCDDVDRMIQLYEKKNNIKFDQIQKTNKKVSWYENQFKTWYKPLPLICMFEAILTYSDAFMKTQGFYKTKLSCGLTIWFRIGEKHSADSILFVHAVSGGLLAQSLFIEKLPKDKSIIIPEIPGISFKGRVMFPPTIRQISKLLVRFAKHKNIKTIQMISHSFGGNILSCIINNQHDYLEKNNISIINTTLIEPIIFAPTLPFIHRLLDEELSTTDLINKITSDYTKIFSYLLAFRDIYAHFYAQRCFLVIDSLVGETTYEKNNIINIVFSDQDELSPVSECVHYLESKKYNGKIKIFYGRKHGAFCLDLEMQKYVLDLIK